MFSSAKSIKLHSE